MSAPTTVTERRKDFTGTEGVVFIDQCAILLACQNYDRLKADFKIQL